MEDMRIKTRAAKQNGTRWLGLRIPALKSRILEPRGNHLTSLSFHFLTCKPGIILPTEPLNENICVNSYRSVWLAE